MELEPEPYFFKIRNRNRNHNFFKSRNRNHNFSKVGTGTVKNSYGSTTLYVRAKYSCKIKSIGGEDSTVFSVFAGTNYRRESRNFLDPCLWLMDPDSDPDPAFSSLTFKTPTKNKFKKKFFCLLLFQVTFSSFFKDKKSKKKSQNSMNHGFSCYFCLMIEGSGAGTLLCLLSGWLLCFPTPAVWVCRPRPLLSSSSRRDSWWAWPQENRPPLAHQTTFPLPPPLRWVLSASPGLVILAFLFQLVLWIRIQLFISMRIRIQGAKLIQIQMRNLVAYLSH